MGAWARGLVRYDVSFTSTAKRGSRHRKAENGEGHQFKSGRAHLHFFESYSDNLT